MFQPTHFIIFLISAMLFHIDGYASKPFIHHQYSIENGLSDNFTSSIIEDCKGFIWITTQYGINRFDGKNFKTFTTKEYPSLLRNDFNCSVADKNGNILFGSYNGVVIRYNQATHEFENKSITQIYGSNFVSITGFYTDTEGSIFALTTSGVFKFDNTKDAFTDHETYVNTRNIRVQSLFIDSQKRMWIGANTGLSIFNSEGSMIAHFGFSELTNTESICLQSYNDSILLIGTSNTGIWSAHTDSQNINRPVRVNAPFKEVNSLSAGPGNSIAIGTRSEGLWHIDENRSQINGNSFTPLLEGTKAITCISADKTSNLWMGTRGAGIICIPASNNSKVIHSSDIDFPTTIVSSFGKDNSGNLWVGTDGDGIFILSPGFDIKKKVTAHDRLSSNGVLAMSHDSDNSFWVASWGGGICRIDEKTLDTKYWATWNSELPLDNCKSICISKDKTIWVATHGEGLTWYNPLQNKWISHKNGAAQNYSFAPDKWLNQVIEGRNGEKWIATIHSIWYAHGDTVRNIISDTAEIPRHLPLFVHCIAANSDGNILAATNRGIYMINNENKQASILNFLPPEEFVSIAFDTKNRCWAVSNNHIYEIDFKTHTTKEISISNYQISANYFTPRAIFIDRSDYIFLGTIDGFMNFHPDSIRKNNTIQTLEVGDIYISSEKIPAESNYLSVNTEGGKTLSLPYNSTNNIRIEFDIVCTDNTQSAFMIEELDDNWTSTGKERSIILNKLSPGDYTLRFKTWVTNNSNEQKSVSLQLRIAPPWWETWWFKTICIILISLIIAGIIKIRFRRITQYNEKLEQEVLNRTSELKIAYDEITSKNKTLSEKQSLIENKNKELAQTITTKDRLMSIIAHDLKNPAFSIVAMLDLIKRNYEKYDPAKKAKLITTAYNSSVTLQNELIKMLEWGTIQQKAFPYKPQNSSIEAIITDVVSFLQQTARDKSIEIRYDAANDFIVFADVQMISIAIRNLVSNAIKYTPRGGVIFILCSRNSNTLFISIKDTGVGMIKEQLQNLFNTEEFTSTRGTSNEKGTGLGLKIVKEFIGKNNGEITVQSSPGKGSCFTITLHLAEENVLLEKKLDSPGNESNNEAIKINYDLFEDTTILIVDDNPGIREHLRNILEKHCNVLEAENGEKGFQIARENKPDIIVSDVDMPNMDGFSLSKEIQNNPSTSHIPLILLTAKSENIDRLRGLLSGAIDYITKPFDEKALLIQLSNLVQIKQNIQKNVLAERLNGGNVETEIDPFLEKLIHTIEEHYTDHEFNVEKLSELMAMSRSTLTRKTSIVIDKKPSELITEYRLETAKKMIDSGNKNISEIAYTNGFTDPRYFSRRFKQYFGQTPTEYKAQF